MNIKITRESIHDALDDMGYNPTKATESLLLDADIFTELSLIAHDLDITVNALVNALIHLKVEMVENDLPSIPGVGTAPYMDENS